MVASSAPCGTRNALAGFCQKFLQGLLHSNGSSPGVAAWKRKRGIAIAFKYKKSWNVGAKVLHQRPLGTKHRAHAGVRAAYRLVVNGEAIFHRGHVDGLGAHALGLQLLDESKRARDVTGERLPRFVGAAVV